MLLAFLLGSALTVQAVQVLDPRADFQELCVSTRADAVAVQAAVDRQGGWVRSEGLEDLTVWRRQSGDHMETLSIGRRNISGGPKDVCSIQWAPGDATLIETVPESLAPVSGVIDADTHLYFIAASPEAVEAREFDFVIASHSDDVTTLLLLRPVH